MIGCIIYSLKVRNRLLFIFSYFLKNTFFLEMDDPRMKPLKNIANVLGRTDAGARKFTCKIEEVPGQAFDFAEHENVMSRNESSKMNNETWPKIKEHVESGDEECLVGKSVGGNSVLSRANSTEKDNAEAALPIDIVSSDKVTSCNNISVMNRPIQSVIAPDEEKSVQIELVSKSTPLRCNLLEVACSENAFPSIEESSGGSIRTDLIINGHGLLKIKTSDADVERDAVNFTSKWASVSKMIKNERTTIKSEVELQMSPVKTEDKSPTVFSEWSRQLKSSTPCENFNVPSLGNDPSSNMSCQNSSMPVIKRYVNLKEIKAKKIDFLANETKHDKGFMGKSVTFPEQFGNLISSVEIESTVLSTPEKYSDTFSNKKSESLSFKLKRQASAPEFQESKRKKSEISSQNSIREIDLIDETNFEIHNTLSNCNDNFREKKSINTISNEIIKDQEKEKPVSEVRLVYKEELKIVKDDEIQKLKKDSVHCVNDDRSTKLEILNKLEIDRRYKADVPGQRKIIEIDLTDEFNLEIQNSVLKSNNNYMEKNDVNTIINNDIFKDQEKGKLGSEVQHIDEVDLKVIEGDGKQKLKRENVDFVIEDLKKNDDKNVELKNMNSLRTEGTDSFSAQGKIMEIDLTDKIIYESQTTHCNDNYKKHSNVNTTSNSNIAMGQEDKLSMEAQHVDKLQVVEGGIKKELKKESVHFVSDDPEENDDNNNPEWELIEKLENDEERYKTVRERWRNLIIPDPNKNLTCIHSRYFKHPGQPNNAGREDNTRNVHKRTFSHEPTTSNEHEHVKRARTRSCTTSYDIKVQNHYKEMEEKSRKLSAEKRHALANTDAFYNRQLLYLMASDLRHYNYWEFQHRIAKLKAQQKEAEEAVHKDFAGAFDRLENEKHRQASVFMKALKEVVVFHKFYRELDEESSRNDCFFLTDIEFEDVMETDTLYEKFNTFYS